MDEIVTIMRNNVVVHSLRVAKHFHKRHDRVLRATENLIAGLPKNGETPKMFFKSTYTEKQNNQTYPMYYMNRDGFSLLVMGFTGKKALSSWAWFKASITKRYIRTANAVWNGGRIAHSD